MEKIRYRKEIIFLFLILLIGVFFRTYKINLIPPGLYCDEAMKGNFALDLLGGKFYTFNNGHPFMIYLVALFIKIFSRTIFAIRFAAIFSGIVTLLVFYLFLKELFSVKIALIGTFFLSISRWHITFSRIGFESILVPAFLCLFLLFFVKALKTEKIKYYILSGIFLGLGMYTYLQFRIVPFLLVLLILFVILKRKDGISKYSKKLIFLILAFLISILPLTIYFIIFRERLFGRMQGVVISPYGNSIIKRLILNSFNSFLMFFIKGDISARHNVPGYPVFTPIEILFFIIGFIYAIKKIKEHGYFLLIIGFFIMQIPNILANVGQHSLRIIGTIPFVFAIISIGVFFTFTLLQKLLVNKRFLKSLLMALFILIFAFDLFLNFNAYFNKWGKNKDTWYVFETYYKEISEFVEEKGENHIYLTSPDVFNHPVCRYYAINNFAHYTFLNLQELDESLDKHSEDKQVYVFIFQIDKEFEYYTQIIEGNYNLDISNISELFPKLELYKEFITPDNKVYCKVYKYR